MFSEIMEAFMTTGNPSYWSEIIQKWQISGCNMTEFCRQEDLSVHTHSNTGNISSLRLLLKI